MTDGLTEEQKRKIMEELEALKDRRKSVAKRKSVLDGKSVGIRTKSGLPDTKCRVELSNPPGPKETPGSEEAEGGESVRGRKSFDIGSSPAKEEASYVSDELWIEEPSDHDKKEEPIEIKEDADIVDRKGIDEALSVTALFKDRKGVAWKSFKDSYGIEKKEFVNLTATETDGTEVEARVGFTLDMGDYQSMRIDAGIKLPTTISSVPEAYLSAWKIVEKELKKMSDYMSKKFKDEK